MVLSKQKPIQNNLQRQVMAMQWFKHMTGAMDDPLIDEIVDRFGGDGYMMFFGTLEVYAKEFKPHPGWYLTISLRYLKKRIRVYRKKKLLDFYHFMSVKPLDSTKIQQRFDEKCAQSLPNLGSIYSKWCVNLDDTALSLFIPNFTKILDNHNARQVLRSGFHSVVATEPLRLEQETEIDKEKTAAGARRAGPYDIEFSQILASLCELKKRPLDFRGPVFVMEKLKQHHHPAAIAYSLAGLAKAGEVKSARSYVEAVLKSTKSRFDASTVDFAVIKKTYADLLWASEHQLEGRKIRD